MPDFLSELVKFREGLGAGRFAHPVKFLQSLAEHDLQVFNQLVHARASRGREMFGDEQLSERLADLAVNHASRALPAGFLLRLAPKHGAIKSKRLLFRRGVE